MLQDGRDRIAGNVRTYRSHVPDESTVTSSTPARHVAMFQLVTIQGSEQAGHIGSMARPI
jgi:hypothetical protein